MYTSLKGRKTKQNKTAIMLPQIPGNVVCLRERKGRLNYRGISAENSTLHSFEFEAYIW